tara:strand:- start:1213 stop:1551 length:339 start_codon:yes stop_codon:yes gene_type:complete
MKKNRINQLIEYITPFLILSYFIIHNIYLVLISITLSLYLINIDRINNIRKSISKNLVIEKESKNENNDKKIKSNTTNIQKPKEDIELTLVEEIEEFGFIPSINKKENANSA